MCPPDLAVSIKAGQVKHATTPFKLHLKKFEGGRLGRDKGGMRMDQKHAFQRDTFKKAQIKEINTWESC